MYISTGMCITRESERDKEREQIYCCRGMVLSSCCRAAGQFVSVRGENRFLGLFGRLFVAEAHISSAFFLFQALGAWHFGWSTSYHLPPDLCSLGLPLDACAMRHAPSEGITPEALKRAHEWIEVREDLLSRVKSLDPKVDANDRNIRPMYAHLLLALRRATIALIRIIADGQAAVGDGKTAGEDFDRGCFLWRGTNYLAKIWYGEVLHLHLFLDTAILHEK